MYRTVFRINGDDFQILRQIVKVNIYSAGAACRFIPYEELADAAEGERGIEIEEGFNIRNLIKGDDRAGRGKRIKSFAEIEKLDIRFFRTAVDVNFSIFYDERDLCYRLSREVVLPVR